MPMYEFECCKCGTVREELVGISELKDRDMEALELSDLNIQCAKCAGTLFKKLLSPHSKMDVNWHSWNNPKGAV
jgi:hypothetical protein